MRFELLKAQCGAVTILQRSLERGRVPTAYLFTGPPGCGRLTAAVALAASLNCEAGPIACGACASCRLYAAGNHPDLHIIVPEKGKRWIVIEQVREEILAKAYLKPMIGGTSTFIVDDANTMNANASNAFLKTLEEPPETSHFVLIAPDRDSVLPTISSRCQTLVFNPLPRKLLEEILVGQGIDHVDAALLAAMAKGSVERALHYHASGALESLAEEFGPLSSLHDFGAGQLLDLSQRWGKNRKDAMGVLEFMSQWYRDMMILSEGAPEEQVIHMAHLDRLKEGADRLGSGALAEVLESVEDARQALDANTNVQLTLDTLLLKVRRRAAPTPA
ncbi:MAG: DNA polymerase III subunit delta' [bacterium]|nr:DNA polymerase III subunit delta' [bacterium]MDT8396497.1 DNA polymerase III subunit delta' [bacterium]